MDSLRGVIPILATPFHADESLDLESWDRMINFMISIGVDGLTVLGVLGEANRLNDHERQQLIEHAAGVIAGRCPLIVGISHAGTAAACHLARMARDAGATAVMVAPQKEAIPSEDRIAEHFQRIGSATDLAVVLQDHPASTDVHMNVALISRIVEEVPTLSAIKAEAVPSPPKIESLRSQLPRPLPILSGLGALYAPFDLAAGCDGFNTGFAIPEVLQAMVGAHRAGDHATVMSLYARYSALFVFEQQPGVAIRKEILCRRGLITTSKVRHPGAAATPTALRQLDSLLASVFPGMALNRRIAP